MNSTAAYGGLRRRLGGLALFLARLSVKDARVHTCKRVLNTIRYRVHVYTIGAFVSVSVSVPWNFSLYKHQHTRYDMIDDVKEINVRSKADGSQLSLPHVTKNNKRA